MRPTPLPGEDLIAVLRRFRPDPTTELEAAGLRVAGVAGCCPLHARCVRWACPSTHCCCVAPRPASGPRTRPPRASCSIPRAAPCPPIRRCRSWRPCSIWRPGSCRSATPGPLPRDWGTDPGSAGLRRAQPDRGRLASHRRCAWSGSWTWTGSGSRWCPSLPMMPSCRDPPSLGVWSRLRAVYRIPERFLVVGGRYDARSDLPTLLAAVRTLRDRATAAADLPCLVLVGAAGDDPEARTRVTAARGASRRP